MEDNDGPPPRKKISRFFPGGRSLVCIARRTKEDSTDVKKNSTPLIEDNTYSVQPKPISLRINGDRSSKSASRDLTEDSQVKDTDDVSIQQSDHQPPPTPATQAAFDLKKLAVKDPRRHGIVGIESLLRSASNSPIFANFRSKEFKLGQPTNPYQSAPFQAGPLPSHHPAQPERLSDLVNGQGQHTRRNASVKEITQAQQTGQTHTSRNVNAVSSGVIQHDPPQQTSQPSVSSSQSSHLPPRKAPPGRSMEDLVRAQAAIGNAPPTKPPPPGPETNYLALRPPVAGPIDPTLYSYLKPPAMPAALQLPPTSQTITSKPRISAPLHATKGNLSKNQLGDSTSLQHLLKRPVSGSQDKAGVDLDRDVAGKKIQHHQNPRPPIVNIPNQGITNLPHHATLTPRRRLYSSVPHPNYYTSPNRIVNAMLTSRKRKRTSLIPPPPAFTYQRTNKPNFNIFNGFLLYPELIFHLASILPLRDLISLYAISRDFHTIIDTRFTTVVLSQTLRKAPECSRAFPFRCYLHLCRKDPAARIPHPNPTAAAEGRVRLIPSFRWVAFILHREKVVHELMAVFAEDGVPLPARCALALKRMWFILDIPDNARRIGYIHNVNLFTDLDLYFAMCFFVKLDMRLNDPVAREKRDGMRRMLLAQESLTTILKVVRRDRWQTRFDVMREWIRYRYDPLPDEVELDIFGVPAEQVGKLKYEYWGKTPPETLKRSLDALLRPDQLVMREAVRRGLRFHRHFLRCLTYGYVRMDTFEDYAPRAMTRRKESLKDEYGPDDDIGGLTWRMEKAGLEGDGDEGGEMLDLGERKQVSLLCIEGGNRSMISEEEKLKMEEQERFLQACMAWSAEEREFGDVDVKMLLD